MLCTLLYYLKTIKGETITTQGRMIVDGDTEGEKFPWPEAKHAKGPGLLAGLIIPLGLRIVLVIGLYYFFAVCSSLINSALGKY